ANLVDFERLLDRDTATAEPEIHQSSPREVAVGMDHWDTSSIRNSVKAGWSGEQYRFSIFSMQTSESSRQTPHWVNVSFAAFAMLSKSGFAVCHFGADGRSRCALLPVR